MAIECRHITGVVTAHLNSPVGAEQMRAMMDRGATPEEITEAFAAVGSITEALLMRAEFAELPADFVPTFMNAWRIAEAGGRKFTLASQPPAQPLNYAHRGMVSYSIEHDNEGVTMYVSHVHGRHAEWYKPAALAAV